MMSFGKKFFFWGIALVVIMACVPSGARPVPPLDSNVINTIIVQTAGAASTQTQAAIPPTSTLTLTPRSTFTSEPTSTIVPPIIFPTATPIKGAQYFRVKHDSQLEMFNYKSRTADNNWTGVDLFTPEVVPLFISPKAGSGTHRTVVDGSWEILINALNGQDERKLRYLKANNTALFDHNGFPDLESLTMGGNVIQVAELQGDWARVNTIDYVNPGALKGFDYVTRPDLIQKFVVVAWDKKTRSTFWVNPPPGAIYWPLVARLPVWIPLERLEPFPSLPLMVTANTEQKVRKTPENKGEETGSIFSVGETGRIVEYYPSASNVWGRLVGSGWIALLKDHKYLTDWSMATRSPP